MVNMVVTIRVLYSIHNTTLLHSYLHVACTPYFADSAVKSHPHVKTNSTSLDCFKIMNHIKDNFLSKINDIYQYDL